MNFFHEKMTDITLDRVRGMFMGCFLGDALGAPHELKNNINVKYSGILDHPIKVFNRFHGTRESIVGQCTDDTEMTLALLRTLIKDQCYDKNNVILSYLKWANSGCWAMGKNTRALLKGVTTIKGYQKRLEKFGTSSQSNGALMRSCPLALLPPNSHHLINVTVVIDDVTITNDNPVCIDCNIIYITALKLALQGYDGNTIFNIVKEMAQTVEVQELMKQIENREDRNIVENKGWCLNSLWCAMIVITSFTNYSEAIDWINTFQKGSDTDTNGCIAGALLGAILGYETLTQEEKTSLNINTILNVDVTQGELPRPIEYGISDFFELTEAAYNLTVQ